MFIGIDIGGSYVKTVWRDAKSGRLVHKVVSAEVVQDPVGWFERFMDSLPKTARQALGSGKLRGVGVGVPGEVRDPGVVVKSPNLPLWRDVPIGPDLQDKLGVPVCVENDANMAALGLLLEAETAQKVSSNTFVFVLGSGVGGGWLVDRQLYWQPLGAETEIGHCVVVPQGAPCSCGKSGCVEAYAGGLALRQAYADEVGVATKDISELIQLADDGDAVAQRLFAEAGDVLGAATSWISNLLGVRQFAFVGGVSYARKHFLPQLRQNFKGHVFPTVAKHAQFWFPPKRHLLGAYGAMYAAENHGTYRQERGYKA